LKLVNSEGKQFWCKWHMKTDSGIKNFKSQEAEKLAGEDPNYATRDLFDHIDKGGVASWTVSLQIIPFEDAAKYKFNIFDVTKVVPHKDYPLIKIGKLVLDRNPTNYFAEVEQSAFSPSHMVPGIEPSPDKMLQGRLFSYPDTHRHRLGVNYQHIPINRPYRVKVVNHQRDGFMVTNDNGGASPNYEPNTFSGPVEDESGKIAPFPVTGDVARTKNRVHRPEDDYVQAGNLFRNVMSEQDRTNLISNLAGNIRGANLDIQKRVVALFTKCDPEYGRRLGEALGHQTSKI